jgi:hypothetical protein
MLIMHNKPEPSVIIGLVKPVLGGAALLPSRSDRREPHPKSIQVGIAERIVLGLRGVSACFESLHAQYAVSCKDRVRAAERHLGCILTRFAPSTPLQELRSKHLIADGNAV